VTSRGVALTMSLLVALCASVAANSASTPTVAEIVAASGKEEWRALDPARTLYLQLPAGRVTIELVPEFAPLHAANILKLVADHYFDGLAVIRVQDNFVAQWGDTDDNKPRPLGGAREKLPAEYVTGYDPAAPFTRLPDLDGYAPQTGFFNSIPAARDPGSRAQWLAHCYGALGVARGNDPESGNGSSLYVVIGQAPRQLDRNIAVVGHVWQGMELLASLPRGSGALGFHENVAQHVPIASLRRAADVPEAERTPLEVLRSESRSFARLLDARRNRRDDWMKFSPGFVDVCNVPIPVRRRDPV
jgi:cyclophilin family peptidyl-prolyl cis-trans isomerase